MLEWRLARDYEHAPSSAESGIYWASAGRILHRQPVRLNRLTAASVVKTFPELQEMQFDVSCCSIVQTIFGNGRVRIATCRAVFTEGKDARTMLMQDKVVMVAGVGSGLGRSVALASAREGADVVLAARTASSSTRWPRRSPRSDAVPCPCRAT
jgi:hypothetical protein